MRGYVFDLIRLMAAGLPIYAVLRIWLLRRRARRMAARGKAAAALPGINKFRELFLGLFVVFMMSLMVFVWQGGEYHSPEVMLQIGRERWRTGEGINLVPFRTIRNFYRAYGVHGDSFSVNVVGNILMFVPWGFGLRLLWKKNRSTSRIILLTAMLPVFIECTQLFIGRQVDVDDFILNFLGGMLGGLLFRACAVLIPGIRTAAE